MTKKGLAPSTIKTELAAIRFFHDNLPYAKYTLPTNDALELKRRTFGGVDRTWSNREYNLMVAKAMETGNYDYAAILTLARYAGLRLEECFRIDTNDAEKAIETGRLFARGKGGLTRYVPINRSIEIVLTNSLKGVKRGEKLFVRSGDKTHLAMKRPQCFISYHRKEFTENQITFHGLRHSCASLLIAQGVDIKIIQEWLGHSSIATTGNIYGHLQFKQKISTGIVLENLLA